MDASAGILLVVFCGLGLIGLIILFVGIAQMVKGNKAKRWPTAIGAIISATIKEHHETSRGNNRTRHYTTYEPVINYEYNVNGVPYTGSRIGIVSTRQGQEQTQKILDGYAPGSSVTVFYNPAKPEEALLEPGKGGSIGLIIAGGVLVFVGILLGIIMAF